MKPHPAATVSAPVGNHVDASCVAADPDGDTLIRYGEQIAGDLCLAIAKRVLIEFRDFGIDAQSIEITAWRNPHEKLARAIASSREGERTTQPTQEVKA